MGDYIEVGKGSGDTGIMNNNSAANIIINQQKITIEELQKKVASLTSGKVLLKNTLTTLDEQLREFEVTLGDRNEKIEQLEDDKESLQAAHSTLTAELENLEAELHEVKNAKASLKEKLEAKIASLKSNKDMLKETLTVLDEQLKEFETAVVDKNEQITQLQEDKDFLQCENGTMREDLKRSQTELNETKSLNVYLEQKLKKTESVLEGIETEQESTVTELQTRISELMVKNVDLEGQIETLTSGTRDLEFANDHLEKMVEALRTETRTMRDDSSAVLNQFFREKNVNCQLQNEFDEAKKDFETKIETMKEENRLLELDKDEKETRLTTMVQQFLKLIEYTKSENVNAKKKKTLVERILGRDKDRDKETYVPPSKTSTLPRKQVNEPATCVIREQNVLQNLEAEANKLRTQLASLKSNKENPVGVHSKTSKSIEPRIKPAEEFGLSGFGEAEVDSALAAMDRAINDSENPDTTDKVSMNTDSEDLSGRERELYFAEQERSRRLRDETDTDDG